MKFKKSLSIAAASIIAAGLIGCGGGGSSSSSTSSTSQPTTVKGVDGYVMNAKVVVNYWDADTNTTKSTTVNVADSYYYTIDVKTQKQKAGKQDYSIAELNSTVLNNVVSVELQSQAQGKTADGSVYAQTFFDANGDGKYDSNSDVLVPAGITLKAPKGYSVITPISTLVATAVENQLNTDKNESNLTNVIADATDKIANALGVDAETIKTVDPLSLVNTTDEMKKAYVVANAIAGGIISENSDNLTKAYDALKAAKKPTNAVEVFANLQKAASDAGAKNTAGILGQIKALVQADKSNLSALIKANLDKTRSTSIDNGGNLVLVSNTATNADFNITDYDDFIGGN